MAIPPETLRAWSQLEWRDPAVALAELRALEVKLASVDVRQRVRRLRTGDLRNVREGRDAALFAHGLATATGQKVYFAPYESSDYDFVTSWTTGDTRHYCPVQLKEIPPRDLAPARTLQETLVGLGKYQTSDTVLAVRLNQPWQITREEITAAKVPFSQVWLFWCASPDQQKWVIQGDMLVSADRYEFTYPALWGAA